MTNRPHVESQRPRQRAEGAADGLPRPRPARAHEARAVAEIFVRSARIEFADTLPASWLAALSVDEEEKSYARLIESDDVTIFLAESEDGPIGYAVSGPNRVASRRYPGELLGIFLLSAAQRRGWGRALVEAVARDMLERGRQGMVVYTHRDNLAARRFYERLGGVEIDEVVRDFDGVGVAEVGYGWSDLNELVGPA